ncbi:MAG: efflux RND transporter periplasmic adaptor subunit [Acidobacteriota bacterium]
MASLEPTPIREQRLASGTVEPWQRVSPGTKIMGRISQVNVDIGDRVEKGQLLARLEDADLRAAVEQARAAIAIAEARLSSAESQFHRMSALADRGSATTRSLEDATSSYQIALASLQQAKADLSSAEATLQYSEVRSPITGFVVAKNVEIGGMAGPGRPFFTIENTAKVKVTAQVAESDIVGLAEGDTAHVDIPVVERSVEATVSRVVPAADPASRTFDVEVHLDNPDQAIKSGMFARISFPRGERQALLIPASALVTRGQLDGVYVVDEQRARLRWVRLGREFETMREVLSGLEPGEVFVVSIPEDLTDGSQVETTS